uniref:Uncharacterized protein n=1 Tax=viral metagenome TaxID=1070528 RepID=A0A6C0JR17_9ZZZZ
MQPSSLVDVCLDEVIFSEDKRVLSNIWNMPSILLEQLDNRCVKMEQNPRLYKRYNTKFAKLLKQPKWIVRDD